MLQYLRYGSVCHVYCFWPLEIITIITSSFYLFSHVFRIVTQSLLRFTVPVLNTVPKSTCFTIHQKSMHFYTITHTQTFKKKKCFLPCFCYVGVNVIIFFTMTHNFKHSSGKYRCCLSEQARLRKYHPLLVTFPHRK